MDERKPPPALCDGTHGCVTYWCKKHDHRFVGKAVPVGTRVDPGCPKCAEESDKICACGHPESRHDTFGCHYQGCSCRAFELLAGKCPMGEAGTARRMKNEE